MYYKKREAKSGPPSATAAFQDYGALILTPGSWTGDAAEGASKTPSQINKYSGKECTKMGTELELSVRKKGFYLTGVRRIMSGVLELLIGAKLRVKLPLG